MSDKPAIAVLGASGFIGFRFVESMILHDKALIRPVVRSYKSMARLARFADLDIRLADATNTAFLE